MTFSFLCVNEHRAHSFWVTCWFCLLFFTQGPLHPQPKNKEQHVGMMPANISHHAWTKGLYCNELATDIDDECSMPQEYCRLKYQSDHHNKIFNWPHNIPGRYRKVNFANPVFQQVDQVFTWRNGKWKVRSLFVFFQMKTMKTQISSELSSKWYLFSRVLHLPCVLFRASMSALHALVCCWSVVLRASFLAFCSWTVSLRTCITPLISSMLAFRDSMSDCCSSQVSVAKFANHAKNHNR